MTHDNLQILMDNRATGGLESEHGLSMWIEVDGKHILFDKGTGKIVERLETRQHFFYGFHIHFECFAEKKIVGSDIEANCT